ncbi:MAG: DNA polymerase/3'-5' exonuclease PolX [Thermoplasmata archaeon]|nr:DNA polymerase/3'-5' exonuclease PolX [Thermoplasmata archaeon]
MKNQVIANIFYQIADMLDIKGEIEFKSRAYRKAAQIIETLEEDLEDVYKREGKEGLRKIPGIGEGLAKKIAELIETNKLQYFENLKKEIPESIIQLMNIPSLGPKKVAVLYKKLGITNVEQLKKACEEGKLRGLDGFGEITERNILRGIEMLKGVKERVLLGVAFEDGTRYVDYLKKNPHIKKVSIAGSLRRMKETIGDIDILAVSDNADDVMEYFVNYPNVREVLAKGRTKSSIILDDGLQVDLRVVEDKSYGAALQYFTGSKSHNIKLRTIGIKKGLKINEYGVFDKDTDKYIAGRTEEEVYKSLGLPYIEPELREDRGEIEAAQKGRLPKLVKYDEIKGDFHVHSNWSDGLNSIEDIVRYALKLGYRFIAITDHSQSLKVAGGLTEKQLRDKRKEIEMIQEKYPDIKIFFGTECDIKADGKLDYSNDLLDEFDIVCAAIHSKFKMSEKEMTERIINAIQNEYVKILAHPTGRLIGKRDAYEVDLEKVIDAAIENNVLLEINAFPDRIDLNDINIRIAKEKGAKFTIGTDAHAVDHLRFIRFGVAAARRGWLDKKDVLNTYPVKEIEKILKSK